MQSMFLSISPVIYPMDLITMRMKIQMMRKFHVNQMISCQWKSSWQHTPPTLIWERARVSLRSRSGRILFCSRVMMILKLKMRMRTLRVYVKASSQLTMRWIMMCQRPQTFQRCRLPMLRIICQTMVEVKLN